MELYPLILLKSQIFQNAGTQIPIATHQGNATRFENFAQANHAHGGKSAKFSTEKGGNK